MAAALLVVPKSIPKTFWLVFWLLNFFPPIYYSYFF